jgi:putative ATPase
MATNSLAPLAERLRPQNLAEYVGQTHLVGPNGVLRRMVQAGHLASLILWGPPGVGKTTLAQLLAKALGRPFFTLSAISAGVKEVREVIERARYAQGTVLFIDEIHRFNKSQQDALLGAVEKGAITLVGATTENPSFEVNSALLSRCQVFLLQPLAEADLQLIVARGVALEQAAKQKTLALAQTAALFGLAGGDARKLLNLLELAIDSVEGPEVTLTDALVQEVAQRRTVMYDKDGEQHYDIVSAFIKSLRGSDPNAALYWLARMIEGGEDPKFIARRMLILASEDIGNANPTALVMATNCFQAVTFVGYPEADLILAQTATYLAASAKSNAAYVGIKAAKQAVQQTGNLPVPLHLRNAPTKLMRDLDYGKGYRYAHDYPGNFVEQEFLPAELSGQKFYDPGANPRENELRAFLRSRWKEKYGY